MSAESDAARVWGGGDRAGSILAAIGVGYLVSHDRRIVEINQALWRILGFSREELIDLEMPWPFTPPGGRGDQLRDRAADDRRGARDGLPRPVRDRCIMWRGL
jgi:PAS domain S-box-containing protein